MTASRSYEIPAVFFNNTHKLLHFHRWSHARGRYRLGGGIVLVGFELHEL